MSDPASQNLQNLQPRSVLALAGAELIFIAGLMHLFLAPEHLGESHYIGGLFIADFVGATVAAFGIYRGHRWGWWLGALVAAGAFVLFALSRTVGLPGVEKGHFESLAVPTKVVEALFLVLCGFEFMRSLTGFRRWALMSGTMVALVVPGIVLMVPGAAAALGLQSANSGSKMPVHWTATSPAIHLGDQYDLVVTNNSDKDQKTQVRTVVMDHRNHDNTTVINQPLKLAPGEERELTAVNDHGDANHFQTTIGSQTRDLDLAVTVNDPAGKEKARFNQEAFLIKGGKAGGKTNGG